MKKNTVDLSVIILTMNAINHVENCLASVTENSSGIKVEIIVSDNYSTDGTAELVKEKFPDVVFIQGENNGYGAGNNRGIKIANGRYVLILNDDTIILDNALEKMVLFMDDNKDVGIIGPKILNVDKTLQPSITNYPSIWKDIARIILPRGLQTNTDWNRSLLNTISKVFPIGKLGRYELHDEIKDVDALKGACLLVSNEVIKKAGTFDEDYFLHTEELDWAYRIKKAGFRVVFFPDAEIIHLGGQTFGKSNEDVPGPRFLQKHKSNLHFLGKFNGSIYNLIYKIGMSIALLTRIFQLSIYLFFTFGSRIAEIKQEREAYDKTLQILWKPSFRKRNMLTEVKFVNSKMTGDT